MFENSEIANKPSIWLIATSGSGKTVSQ